MRKTNKGQALIEVVWTLPCLFAIFSGLLAILYFGFARAWIGFQQDQAIFCLAEGQPSSTCESELRKALTTRLPIGRIETLRLQTFPSEWQAHVRWSFAKVEIKTTKRLKWDSSIWR